MKIYDLFKKLIFETDVYEFKQRLNEKENKQWLKTICGFANSKGGHIFIGVNDEDKEIIPFSEREADTIKQTINNSIISNITPIPKYNIEAIKVNNNYIVKLTIYNHENGITFFKDKQVGNQIFVRRDGQTMFALPEEIEKLAQNNKKYEYDKTVLGIKSSEITFNRLNDEYQKANHGENITAKLLKSMGLISHDNYLTVAGLLFSDYEDYDNSRVSFTIWPAESKGDKSYIDSKTYKGNILDILYKTVENIGNVPYYVFGGRKTDERRIDSGSFSLLTLREAIINAIAHRDYTIDGNEIAIDCFTDRIEINSPGSMLHGQTIGYQRIDENTASQRRNGVICLVLEKLKLMENKGSGFARIVEDYRDLGDDFAPLYKASAVTFTIRLVNKKQIITSKNETTPITTSKNYLNNIALFKKREDLIKANPNFQIIIAMIENDKATDYLAISNALGITRDGAKYYINKLRAASLIRRQGSNRAGYYEILNDSDRPADFMNLDEETKRITISWCKKNFLSSKTIFIDRNSYDFKIFFEKATNIYLTNGQFKGAMLLAGFSVENILDLNWHFKISKNSPAVMLN